ncbi:hypothetical protein, partial [Cyclobacterium amurskyense]|uniref:hypothetical protein n=1 Tax=Cyclobacterium amurskyense TaxID=320787 RepID=UPI0030DD6D0F
RLSIAYFGFNLLAIINNCNYGGFYPNLGVIRNYTFLSYGIPLQKVNYSYRWTWALILLT